ncbi:MAG TPA: type II toxin-antitoxin system HicB family antitoxin [Methylococcaceae bacterium]|nr:type II toxin-antitoxin system HicB family antitoxin [Methylococcaceae bacterium]
MMEYKGYIGRVEFDDEAGLFHGEVINTRDVITFQGTTVEELKREFQTSVDVYLEFCTEQGKTPDDPRAGHLVLDVAPELQAAMVQAARREHKNLDSWIVDRLKAGAGVAEAAP